MDCVRERAVWTPAPLFFLLCQHQWWQLHPPLSSSSFLVSSKPIIPLSLLNCYLWWLTAKKIMSPDWGQYLYWPATKDSVIMKKNAFCLLWSSFKPWCKPSDTLQTAGTLQLAEGKIYKAVRGTKVQRQLTCAPGCQAVLDTSGYAVPLTKLCIKNIKVPKQLK